MLFFRMLKTCKLISVQTVAWGRQREDYECGKRVLFEGWCTEHAFSVATSVSALCQL